MYGSLVRVLEETAQVEVQLETSQKYWVPYDRVEFKDTNPKLQENEYGTCLSSHHSEGGTLTVSSDIQHQSKRAHSVAGRPGAADSDYSSPNRCDSSATATSTAASRLAAWPYSSTKYQTGRP